LKTLKFTDGDPTPRIAILIKESAFREQAINQYYVQPLVAAGIPRENIVAFSLEYFQGKASAAIVKDWIATWFKAIVDSGVTHILCADSAYFKGITKESKADPLLGIAVPSKVQDCPEVSIFYSLGYGALIHNPNQEHKITNSIYAMVSHYQGNYVEVGTDIIHMESYPQKISEIEKALQDLHQYPELVTDIETFSLNLRDAGLASIGFAWNKHEGLSFLCDYRPIPEDEGFYGTRKTNLTVRKLLRTFFDSYQGKIIAHNASFDFKNLIHCLWMEHPLDWKGMILGLETLTRCFDDTKIIAYLALNSCAKQEYGLKKLAQPFAGNWAESEINDVRRIQAVDLLRYNLVDCLSTWYVKETYEPLMDQDNQRQVYEEIMLPSLITIIQMECHGVPLDPKRVDEVELELQTIKDEIIHLLDSSMYVVDATDRIQENAMHKANAKLKKKVRPRHEFTEPMNFGSGDQLAVLLYQSMELPIIEFTDSGDPSTSTKTLEKLINHARDEDMRTCLQKLIELSKVSKVLDAFIPTMQDAWIKADGYAYLHGSFNLGGTKSGRLSSNGPNLQNLPAKGPLAKLIKSCFVSPQSKIFCSADFNALEDRINTILTNDPNKVKIYSDGYDSHSFRTFYYWGDQMPDIVDTVESINSIPDLYPDLRSRSKNPTFALTFLGTWMTLMKNCGFPEDEAKRVEANYHKMYEASGKWVKAKIDQAAQDGYTTLAFGLRLRTPLLKKTVMGSSLKSKESEAEARTMGNAVSGQSYGLLNCRAANEMRERIYTSPYKYDIMPIMQIHDAQYYIIKDDLEVVEWFNRNLTECMSWQELPELKHDVVNLGAETDLHFPSWKQAITLKNDASIEDIILTVDKELTA